MESYRMYSFFPLLSQHNYLEIYPCYYMYQWLILGESGWLSRYSMRLLIPGHEFKHKDGRRAYFKKIAYSL